MSWRALAGLWRAWPGEPLASLGEPRRASGEPLASLWRACLTGEPWRAFGEGSGGVWRAFGEPGLPSLGLTSLLWAGLRASRQLPPARARRKRARAGASLRPCVRPSHPRPSVRVSVRHTRVPPSVCPSVTPASLRPSVRHTRVPPSVRHTRVPPCVRVSVRHAQVSILGIFFSNVIMVPFKKVIIIP
eukprot:gene9793-biopygen12775